MLSDTIAAAVVLVNENDEPVGTMEKLEAHQRGLLHRAFSVFVFNQRGEMLLQQRAAGKYHSQACGPTPAAAILRPAKG
ncbi:NUDIX domain-containing protein [Chitinophaga sedimenti]|uniref:NUDIX domain-containing protein n=1 Tax=Chitinophaga sedimenti TaxID=2033606 RepID=UPI002006B360|nr:NUDIX domain-containing protein [Chitinophaga sedimenti]MCK7558122.1 NUDIX domain-containing protein [Chitinophaga sedimenti]